MTFNFDGSQVTSPAAALSTPSLAQSPQAAAAPSGDAVVSEGPRTNDTVVLGSRAPNWRTEGVALSGDRGRGPINLSVI